MAELDGAGNVVARFVYGSNAHVPDYMTKGGATYRIVSDQLGSVRLVVNASSGAEARANETRVPGGDDVERSTCWGWFPPDPIPAGGTDLLTRPRGRRNRAVLRLRLRTVGRVLKTRGSSFPILRARVQTLPTPA